METKTICTQIPTTIHRQLKIHAARNGFCIAGIIDELVDGYVKTVVKQEEEAETRRVRARSEGDS